MDLFPKITKSPLTLAHRTLPKEFNSSEQYCVLCEDFTTKLKMLSRILKTAKKRNRLAIIFCASEVTMNKCTSYLKKKKHLVTKDKFPYFDALRKTTIVYQYGSNWLPNLYAYYTPFLINFDVPMNFDAYSQRVTECFTGRTDRKIILNLILKDEIEIFEHIQTYFQVQIEDVPKLFLMKMGNPQTFQKSEG